MAKHSNIRPGLGLHLPDRDFFHEHEMNLARDLMPSIFLAMLYEADKGGADQVNQLVADAGHEDTLARIQIDRVVDLDPAWCAAVAVERAKRLHAIRVHVVTGNELNYIGEGFDGDIDRVMRWLANFAAAFAFASDRRYILHLPAPWSGDVGENNEKAREYWRACKAYGLDTLYDVADVHEYAEGYGLHADCQSILEMETWTTEHNRCMQAAADSTRMDAENRVECAIYFIATWENYNPGPMGTQRPDDQFSLTWHPELIDQFIAANASVSNPAPKPEPEPEAEPEKIVTNDEAKTAAKMGALGDYWAGDVPAGPLDLAGELGKYWLDHRDEMGSAFGPEHYAKDADGNIIGVYQAFAGGVWAAYPGDPWTVERV